MTNGIRTTLHQPSPFADLQPGAVVNFDNHGSFWGIDTVDLTEGLIAKERANGAAIDEWNVTDRDGNPLRIVRIADPDFLDTISVFTKPSRTAVGA